MIGYDKTGEKTREEESNLHKILPYDVEKTKFKNVVKIVKAIYNNLAMIERGENTGLSARFCRRKF